jgi:hypothetical protein
MQTANARLPAEPVNRLWRQALSAGGFAIAVFFAWLSLALLALGLHQPVPFAGLARIILALSPADNRGTAEWHFLSYAVVSFGLAMVLAVIAARIRFGGRYRF